MFSLHKAGFLMMREISTQHRRRNTGTQPGALVVTSLWHGKSSSFRVLGTWCIESTPHFRVCYVYEHLLTEGETALRSSTALPSDI